MSVFGKADCKRDIYQVMDDEIWIFFDGSAAHFQFADVQESKIKDLETSGFS